MGIPATTPTAAVEAAPPLTEKPFVVVYSNAYRTRLEIVDNLEICALYRDGEELEQIWCLRDAGLERCQIEEMPRTSRLRAGLYLWIGRDLVATITAHLRLCAFCCHPALSEAAGVGLCAAHAAGPATSPIERCDFCTAPADCELGEHSLCATHAIIEAEQAAAECQA